VELGPNWNLAIKLEFRNDDFFVEGGEQKNPEKNP
jgi:hypothetical protein